MAKATLDDILKEQKKQTKLLEKIEKTTRKQINISEVADKVAGKMIDAIDSDLGSDEEKEFWIDTDQAELVGCEVIDFEGVNGLEVLNATFSIRWKRDWQLPESNVEKLANCRFKLKCETAE